MRRKRGKPERPRPVRDALGGGGVRKERLTGRWSVRAPQEGRMVEEVFGKKERKGSLASHRSRRAPD